MSSLIQTVPKKPVHLLSQKSSLQKRDVFLFDHEPGSGLELCGGLNLDRYGNPTIATFYRWMDLVDYQTISYPFIIWRIEVVRVGILAYSATRIGQPLSRTSTDPMLPGDYAAYLDDGAGTLNGMRIGLLSGFLNFLEADRLSASESSAESNEKRSIQDNIEPFSDLVKQRDQGMCCVTGNFGTNTTITWLVPPSWAPKCNPDKARRPYLLIKAFSGIDNTITIDAELLQPFLENKFGIDVENEYRIIIFEDFPQAHKLGTHLFFDFVAKSQKRADTFIRGHFKWCLAVHFLGGDVSLEFPDRGQELMDDAYDNGVDETEEKWQTTLGKEILDFWGIL